MLLAEVERMAGSLLRAQRNDEALVVSARLVELMRSKTQVEPADHEERLARVLLDHGVAAASAGARDLALTAYEDAARIWRTLVALDPLDSEAWVNLAASLACSAELRRPDSLGEHALESATDAAAAMDRALELGADEPIDLTLAVGTHLLLGEIYQHLGKRRRARRALDRATTLSTRFDYSSLVEPVVALSQAGVHQRAARVARALGAATVAEDHWSAAVRLVELPHVAGHEHAQDLLVSILEELAQGSLELQRTDVAIAAYDRLLALDGDDSAARVKARRAWWMVGRALGLLSLDRSREAVESCENAISEAARAVLADPGDGVVQGVQASALVQMAGLHKHLGDPESVFEPLTRAANVLELLVALTTDQAFKSEISLALQFAEWLTVQPSGLHPLAVAALHDRLLRVSRDSSADGGDPPTQI